MSADNYLYVTRNPGKGIEVFHLFASDEEVDLSTKRPMFITTEGPERAVRWAHDWARENVCEYGVRINDSIYGPRTQNSKPEAK